MLRSLSFVHVVLMTILALSLVGPGVSCKAFLIIPSNDFSLVGL